ncbi:hypothetical protein MNBD_GAMMA09-1101 [hydrothermal vent metagenome]|uniref:Uncharacterized protein n=1 Tax=hydrothermal vent metagenome TaxID=652676 RepID=A0A3B0X7F1_9ZZZZ
MSNITNINVQLCKNCSVSKNGDAGTVIQGCRNISECPYLSVQAKFDKIIEAFKTGNSHKNNDGYKSIAIA